MKGKSGSGKTTLLKGLKNRSPMDGDKSMRCGSGRVNAEPVRKSVAKSHSIGPRTA